MTTYQKDFPTAIHREESPFPLLSFYYSIIPLCFNGGLCYSKAGGEKAVGRRHASFEKHTQRRGKKGRPILLRILPGANSTFERASSEFLTLTSPFFSRSGQSQPLRVFQTRQASCPPPALPSTDTSNNPHKTQKNSTPLRSRMLKYGGLLRKA